MLHNLSIGELGRSLTAGRISSVELTRHFLPRIERLNPALNALITLTAEQALAEAAFADAKRAAGERGPLLGIPLIHKDIFCTDGVRTSCGSRMLDNFIAPYDATVVTRLKSAGTVMLGKANMDEFAMGSSNETSFYGPVKNPWDLSKVPGGSSGGSAAAAAARLAAYTTGTDTGGSIRQPAALTGITGLKTNLWTRVAVRHDWPLCVQSRPGGRPCSAPAVQDQRPSCSRPWPASIQRIRPVSTPRFPTIPPRWTSLSKASLRSVCCRNSSTGLKPATVRWIHDALKIYQEPWGANRGRQPAAPAVVGTDLLCGRARGMLLQSVAIRRRALRLHIAARNPRTCWICTSDRGARDSAPK